MRLFVLLFLILLAPWQPKANAKEVLVLLPINVDASLKNESVLFGTALQQGLSQNFEVFFGPAVEEKLKVEYAKEGCTAQSCAQNLAIAFNGELIGDTSIQKLENSYVVQLQINNIVTGKIARSLIEICDNCSKLSLIQFVKNIGLKAGRSNSTPAPLPQTVIADAPTPSKRLDISTGSFDTEVFINGENLGRAPLTTSKAYPEGERIALVLRTPGYKELRFSHIVGRNDQQLSNISLLRDTVRLRIESSPSRGDVFIDGNRIGRTPAESDDIPVGETISVEIKKDGYEPLSISHRVGDNDERLKNLLLDVLKRKLYVDSRPRAARIFVENRFIGETPAEIGPFEDGERVRIRLERDGFETVSLRHRVGRSDESLSRIALNRETDDKPASQSDPERVRVPMGF
jgi:hypothetical protein